MGSTELAPRPERDPHLERIAGLLGWEEPTSGIGVMASYPPCPPFYATRVVKEAFGALQRASGDRLFLYLQGAVEGVGVSEFLRHFTDVSLAMAPPHEHPVVLLDLMPTAGQPRRFLDALSHAVGVRLSNSDLSLRDASTVGDQILFALASYRVRLIVIDHAHHLSEVAQLILAYLMRATSRARYEVQSGAHLSVVLASHLDPRHVLRPGLASALDMSPVHFSLYTREDIAEVLPQIGLVEADFDPSGEDGYQLLEEIYGATQGRVIRMNPLFRAILATRRPGQPTTKELLHYAGALTEGITRLTSEDLRNRHWEWEPNKRHHISMPGPHYGTTQLSRGPDPKAPNAPSIERAKKLTEDRARAEDVRRQLTHKRPSRKRPK